MAGVTIGGGALSVQRSLLTIAASTNDANPGVYSAVLVVLQASSLDITGFSGGEANRILCVIGGSGAGLNVKHQSASSSAANRCVLNGGTDKSVPQWHCLVLVYSAGDSRWKQVGAVTILV